MQKTAIGIFLVLLNLCLYAQHTKRVTVKAGSRIIDYFPAQERFRYPEFREGECILKDGTINPGRYNYNFLTGEMEFIRLPDTLSISRSEDVNMVTIASDTFYYHNGYLELISSGPVKVFLKQVIIIKEVQRKGAFGVINRGSSFESYTGVDPRGLSYNRIQNEDLVLQNSIFWFFSTPVRNYERFNRKNVIGAFPGKEDIIKSYLKSNAIDFESREDLLRMADFMSSLLKYSSCGS